MLPVNVPLPTKIVTQVLPPIDIAAEFGDDPDIDAVDAQVRAVMQEALDELAKNVASRCWDDLTWRSSTEFPRQLGLVGTMVRAGVIAPLRPDKYLRIAAAMAPREHGHHVGVRQRGAALPGSPGPDRRAGHPDLARNRPAR